jgi:two-component system, cell cycle response regulator DivK
MFPKKILIIDDEPLVLKSVSLLLKKAGMTPTIASSGPEGLQLAAKDCPDLILLDLKMPKMSGWEVLSQLKNDDKLKTVSVVIFSAEAIPDSDRVAKELDVVAILQKPLHVETLTGLFGKRSEERLSSPTRAQASGGADLSKNEDIHRIVVARNMTGPFVNELEKYFLERIKSVHNTPVVLDLTDVSVVDSRGIALCIGLKKECDGKGSKFSIDTNSELHKMFKIFKLTKVIDMKEVNRP